ncbi:AMP-binding protein [Streptomyces sp. DG2A-72]|uniref:AMP-binding protein n=1 Tax=Streptomyces sp. DG2A-72 TaxID=3051386 RepID=UPI00265C56E4|nr:AMP-binding protein [Streptomyces sp. DG2A-72]MDO0931243.1 AMP-binding protein [Streptomyces sp. DG2A-72]
MPRPSSNGAVAWPAEYAERYTAKGYWEGIALGDRLHAVADATPDTIALVDGDRRLTYRQLAEHADAAALRLAALGLRPDDRLVVQPPNTAEFVILTYACLRLGVIFTPAHVAAYLSTFTTLEAGDLILTGTPGGVGAARDPKVFLKPGQVVRTVIEGVGECVNTVVEDKQ